MFGVKKRLKKMINNSFGKNPLEGYLYYNAEKRLDNVRRFHNAIDEGIEERWKVDDVTWNDLEMDQVFLRINHTNSFIGEQTLYHRMHLLDKGKNSEKINVLEKRLTYLRENPEARLDIETQINYIGKKEEGYYLPEFLLNSDWWEIGNTSLYHVLQILLIIGFISSAVFNNVIAVAGLVCIALINLIIYLFSKQKYEIYFNSLADFKKIYDFAKWMEDKDREPNIFVTYEVRNAIHRLRRMSKVIFGMNGRRQASLTGDVVAILREYIWGILLIDVSMSNHIMRIIGDKQEDVLLLLDFLIDLKSKQQMLQSSIDLCQKMIDDRAFDEIDTNYYLDYVKEEEANGRIFEKIDDFIEDFSGVTRFNQFVGGSYLGWWLFPKMWMNRMVKIVWCVLFMLVPIVGIIDDLMDENGISPTSLLFWILWIMFLGFSFISVRRPGKE